MDEVFKALADPTRRGLLDELFERDGQTLSALEGRLPMSRFGVMKHLKVLEEAGLVTTAQARSREAPLPQPRPDPARLRALGEQVRRALGRGADRTQTRNRGGRAMNRLERTWEVVDGRGDGRLRDLHQDDAGATLGGDHRRGAEGEVQLRGRVRRRTGRRAPSTRPRFQAWSRSPPARTSRSTRRGASCRASRRCGARTCARKAPRG